MRRKRRRVCFRRALDLEALESRRLLSIFSEDTAASAGLTGVSNGSVAWGDYDNDGDLDILLTGYSTSTRVSKVYRNDGGTFTDAGANLTDMELGSAAWGDYDNDGDLDILLTGWDGSSRISRVYNNTSGTFTDAGANLPGALYSFADWGDYDNDGDLDILLTGQDGSGTAISKVYTNNGETFTDAGANLIGVYDSSAAWGDYDNDGDLDILLTGYSTSSRVSQVYNNDGGTFTDAGANLPGVYYGSTAWGDYDNDGDLDILLTGWGESGGISRVYNNDGGTFHDVGAAPSAVSGGSAAWGDYDNDGDLDILLTGRDGSHAVSKVYNNDSGTFDDVEATLLAVSNSSVAWGDYDNDGDLDILLTGRTEQGEVICRVYQNDGEAFNQAPNAPTGLAAAINERTSAMLSWIAPADNAPTPGGMATPSAGLSYNLRVGTTPGAADVVAPMSFAGTTTPPDGRRMVAERGPIQTTSWTLTGLTPGTPYYWGVQAVDTALAGGPFAAEASFTIVTDFGDAPAPYSTLLGDNGAVHLAAGPTLGATRDWEPDGLPSRAADGDDLDTGDDEDGVSFAGSIMTGQLDARVRVHVQNAPEGAKLDAWIDFNADGCWGGPGEQIADGVTVNAGDNTLWFDVPSWAASGTTYARFRLSTAGDLAPTGPALDGEVEDYAVSIIPPVAAAGLFGEPIAITTGALGARDVFAADLDGDGHMDILSASFDDDTFAWFKNDGHANFTAMPAIDAAADGARSVFAADVDGDGDLDVLSASYNDDTIAWYENSGWGSFSAEKVISGAANGARSVFAADVDGDGDLDVVAALTDSSSITWYENTDGKGTFSAAKVIDAAATGAQWVFAADVNGDGYMDVLSASYGNDTIAWYRNVDGKGGAFERKVITNGADLAHSVFAADLDADGDLDVLSASGGGGNRIAWYRNDGNGDFQTMPAIDATAYGSSVFAADINGDGHMDVLSASALDVIAWYENDGNAGFSAAKVITDKADRASSVFAADVNGDGVLDVLSASAFDNSIVWYTADRDGDGVEDGVEALAGGGSGDGNTDGIPDSQQPHVASLPNAADGQYLTIVTLEGSRFRNVRSVEAPPLPEKLAGIDPMLGCLDFEIHQLATDGTAVVDLIVPNLDSLNTLYNFGRTADDPTFHWYEFHWNDVVGAERVGDKIVVHYKDGELGDNDLAADGKIVDPAVPAFDALPYHNRAEPFDVNDDLLIAPLDVLLTINDINHNGIRTLDPQSVVFSDPDSYVDTNGDGVISPLDALVVINFINERAAAEGESPHQEPALQAAPLLEPLVVGTAMMSMESLPLNALPRRDSIPLVFPAPPDSHSQLSGNVRSQCDVHDRAVMSLLRESSMLRRNTPPARVAELTIARAVGNTIGDHEVQDQLFALESGEWLLTIADR